MLFDLSFRVILISDCPVAILSKILLFFDRSNDLYTKDRFGASTHRYLNSIVLFQPKQRLFFVCLFSFLLPSLRTLSGTIASTLFFFSFSSNVLAYVCMCHNIPSLFEVHGWYFVLFFIFYLFLYR